MRLHRLTVQAFGPFPGHVEVDLDALSSAGIFLIHGPTGAGKTSLLDAICFALYAAVPGARPSGRSLRSDHAKRDAIPRVALEFTASGRRLRIARSPEFRRPKRRGAGETTVPASVTLTEWLDAGWVTLSHRADEVGDAVKDVLGIGMQQFVKVVLLPQGDFAAFLRSTPESRRELLERLFDVSRFTDVEEWLADQRRRSAVQLAETKSALDADLTRVDDVLARLPPELMGELATWDTVAECDLDAVLGRLVDEVREQAATALAERDTTEAHERDRLAAHEQAERQVVCRHRGQHARDTLAALDARRGELDTLAESLAAGRRAAAVAGDMRALADAVARQAAARERNAAAEAEVADLGLAVAVTDHSHAQALLDSVTGFDGCLAEAAALTEALAAARRRVARQEAHVASALDRRCKVEAEIERLVEAATTVTRHAEEARVIAAARHDAQRHVDELTNLLRRRRDLLALEDHLSALRARAQDAVEAALDARCRWLDLRQEHLDGMAARLAADLVDGRPCPVCGSARHPRPADPAHALPDDVVAAAESAYAEGQGELETAQTQVANVEGRALVLQSELADEGRDTQTLSADLVAANLVAANQRRDAAEASMDRLAHYRELAEALEAELDAAREQREHAEGTAQEAAGRLGAMRGELHRTQRELTERLDRHTGGCPCAWPTSSDLDETVDRHASVAAAFAGLVDSMRALWAAQEHAGGTAEATATQLSEKGFGSVREASAALLPEDTLSAHERVLAQAERERVQAQTVLLDPEVAAALEHSGVDVVTVATELAQARQARQRADRTHTIAEQCDRDLTHLRVLVAERVARRADQIARHGTLARLADTVTGLGTDNLLRMRLSAYVLAARLERVVELANERLAHMGDGRYQLRHSDTPVAGGRRSGLGLAIEDLWTGQARDTATLSGGESFMASLALALGLADGVREEAGGFELQTLFVDEGFGSLDEDSLEQVLVVLDELRDGGRAVGVVSHVADLRARIPHQLRVTKAAGGSRVSMLADGGAA